MFNDQVIQPSDGPTSFKTNEPSIVDDFMYGSNVAQSHITIRLGFLRKVYGILAAQLAFTTLVCTVIMASAGIQDFLKTNSWLVMINLLGTLGIMLALMVKRTEYPTNYYLLGAFTFFESLSIGFITSFYETWIVVQAFCLTTLIVVGLTMYTFQTKRDFQAGGALLTSLLLLLIFGGFFQIFFQNQFLHTILAVGGAFLFSAFIVYDTQMIMKTLHAEEYIVGVINLYLDIINLFLEILKILDSLKRN